MKRILLACAIGIFVGSTAEAGTCTGDQMRVTVSDAGGGSISLRVNCGGSHSMVLTQDQIGTSAELLFKSLLSTALMAASLGEEASVQVLGGRLTWIEFTQ